MSQSWRGAPRPSGWENYPYLRNRVSDDEVLVVLGALGFCWCGQEFDHDWPGKALGAPHPSLEEVVTTYHEQKQKRAEERAAVEERLKHSQMKKFKREVREIILRLVNEHEVEYRLQKDGQHIFLYSGARGERPFKIAAARPAVQQMRYLLPWLRENFPDFNVESESSETAYGEHLFDPNDETKCKVCGFEQDDGRAEHFVDSSPEKAYVEPHPLADEIEVTEIDEAPEPLTGDPKVREQMKEIAEVDLRRCKEAGEHIVVTKHPEVECPYAYPKEDVTGEPFKDPVDEPWAESTAPKFPAEGLGPLLDDYEPSMTEEERQAQHEAEEDIGNAIETLAQYLGYVVLRQEEWNEYAENRHALDEAVSRAQRAEVYIKDLQNTLDRERRERDGLKQERDDLRAKLTLIKEATGL